MTVVKPNPQLTDLTNHNRVKKVESQSELDVECSGYQAGENEHKRSHVWLRSALIFSC